jgi:hypothetical protein
VLEPDATFPVLNVRRAQGTPLPPSIRRIAVA